MMDVPLVGRLNAVFVIAIGFRCSLFWSAWYLISLTLSATTIQKKHGLTVTQLPDLYFTAPSPFTAIFLCSREKTSRSSGYGSNVWCPASLMFLKEPLTNLVERKKTSQSKKACSLLKALELFEVLLSYLSNTLSFLRIGAFAVSHAAMMEVVMMLAGAARADPLLDRYCPGQSLCLRYGGTDRRYPGTPSGVL